MRNWTFMQWLIAIIIAAATVAIVLVALPAMGIIVPAWAINIFWIFMIACVAIIAIGLLVKLWQSWGGPPGPS